MEESSLPLKWVILGITALVLAFGWAFMAAGYAHDVEDWRSGGVEGASELQTMREAKRSAFRDFVGNAFSQMANPIAVFSWNFSNRLWLPICIFVAVIGLIIGGKKMKALEEEMNAPRHRRS